MTAKLGHLSRNMGSVSHATMRSEDLIPAFLDCLESQRPLRKEHRKLVREIRERMEAEQYFDSEDSHFDLEELFDVLGEYAPEYFYFGSHPGDGSDYGFWLSEDFPDDSFDGLRVSDLSEVPTGYAGEVLEVNDHGNMTLYLYSRNGRKVELRAVV